VPPTYLFTRSIGFGPHPEETEVRRVLTAGVDESYQARALLEVSAETPDRQLDALIGSPVGAFGASRVGSLLQNTGRSAIDGNLSTAWEVAPSGSPSLTVYFPSQLVSAIDLDFVVSVPSHPAEYSRVRGIEATLKTPGGELQLNGLVGVRVGCVDDPKPGSDVCIERLRVDFPPSLVSSVEIEITQVDTALGIVHSRPVRLAELRLAAVGENPLSAANQLGDQRCRSLLQFDSEPIRFRPAQPRFGLSDLTEGLNFLSCEEVFISAGTHRLESLPWLSARVLDVVLVPAAEEHSGSEGPSTDSTAEVLSSDPVRRVLSVTGSKGAYLLSGVGYHPGWKATADGIEFGEAMDLDGYAGWELPVDGSYEVTISFAPQRTYARAWVIAAIGLAVCLTLSLRGVWASE
jgi:hypothetical protein